MFKIPDKIEYALPDPFYLEDTEQGPQRTSIRDKIVREIASNILIHREYTNGFPAKIIIERKRIYSENANGKPQLFDEDVFKLIVPIPDFSFGPNEPVNDNVNDQLNDTVKLSVDQKIILKAIEEDIRITLDELAKQLDKSVSTVSRNIRVLKKRKIIKRVGADRNGKWVIIKKK